MLNPTRTNAQACSQNCLAPSACYSEAPCLPVHGLDRLHIKWLCVQCTDHAIFPVHTVYGHLSRDELLPSCTFLTHWLVKISPRPCWLNMAQHGVPSFQGWWRWLRWLRYPSRAGGTIFGKLTSCWDGGDGARRTATPRPTGLALLCPLSSAVMSWYWAHSPDLDDPFL